MEDKLMNDEGFEKNYRKNKHKIDRNFLKVNGKKPPIVNPKI